MRQLNLLILIIFFFNPSHSLAKEDVLKASHGKNTPSYFDKENLTDREKWDSENFVHQGLSVRTLKESCEKDEETMAACRGQASNKKFLGMSPGMVQAISRMYATVIGAAGGGMVSVSEYDKAHPDKQTDTSDTDKITDKKDSTNTTDKTQTSDSKNTEKENKNDEKSSDYCKYIAMGTEGVATVQQTLGQKSIQDVPTNEATAQKDALHKAAQEHENRSTQAKTQTIGWGVTTACYAGMMTAGNASAKAWQNWAKLGASAILTVFFKGQIGAHDEYKDKVLEIANKLPGKGDCNPITQRDCYCVQEETKYDPKYCLPYLHQEKLAKSSLRVACIDSKLAADPKCDCIKTDNCYDKEYMNTINGLQFGKAALGGVAAPFGNLARGKLSGANLSSDSSKLFARAQGQLKKIKGKKLNTGPRVKLSTSAQAEEDALVKLGLSRGLANKLASTPVNSNMKSAMGRFSGKRNRRYSRRRKPKNKVLRFSGGRGLNKKKSRSKSKNGFMSKFGKKNSSSKRGSKVLNYANKAKNQAQIHHNKGRIIFDIISHRYQTSGIRRLQLTNE